MLEDSKILYNIVQIDSSKPRGENFYSKLVGNSWRSPDANSNDLRQLRQRFTRLNLMIGDFPIEPA
jgi:hypothetical protein